MKTVDLMEILEAINRANLTLCIGPRYTIVQDQHGTNIATTNTLRDPLAAIFEVYDMLNGRPNLT